MMGESSSRVDGAKMRAARDAKEWSQEKLAEKAGYKLSVIQKLEQGTYFSRRCLECCAEALDVLVADLLASSESGVSDAAEENRRIPLHILCVGMHAHGPGEATAALMQHFRTHDAVRAFGTVNELQTAKDIIRHIPVNTVFIDPFVSVRGVEDIASFVLKVRKDYPEIVFVLYTTPCQRQALCTIDARFEHYFFIEDSHLVFHGKDNRAIDEMLRRCQQWHEDLFEYDLALSFAGEDREYARQIAGLLVDRGTRVFYDEYEQSNLLGKDRYTHLHQVYSQKARYCAILISSHYADKMWTSRERRSAQKRAMRRRRQEYILPLRLDDTRLPGLMDTVAYTTVNDNIPKVTEIIMEKLWIVDASKPKGRIGEWLFEHL
jgi:hypothetical protein